MPGRVVVTDHVFGSLDPERSLLEPLGVELVEADASDEATLAKLAGEASALLVCYAKVTAPVIEAAARAGCRVISRYGTGVDNIDLEAATKAGLLVTYVPDYCMDEVADHTLALMLGLARGVVGAAVDVRAGGWTPQQPGVRRLRGRRLALVGVGRIGRGVAERARSFGLEVVAYDPYVREWDLEGVAQTATLEETLAEADFVSLHAPLTDETRHVIRAETIGWMRRAPVVVNAARGPLVHLDDATRALEEGRLGGLALDVTEVEPLPADHPLRSHPLAIVTPHMAFYSPEAQDELQSKAADEVARALRGEPPRRPVNPEVLERNGG